ncbi:MAG: hypothetical protein RBT25_11090 [Lentisphaeria bacterium]|nr:hypothetical protein [Lentisphaeria bacterium]
MPAKKSPLLCLSVSWPMSAMPAYTIQAGGGTVLFPAGTYLSDSIHMRSDVELHLENGATMLQLSTARRPD